MPQLDAFAAESFSSLPPKIVAAIEASPLPGLDDRPRVAELASLLNEVAGGQWPELTAGQQALCTSGLWLLAGDLDRSHTISQSIGSAEGSFWHGIMHRREGDYGNAKYWFRRVGQHPVLDQIHQLVGSDYQDPFEFVDACSRAVRSGDSSLERCTRAQWLEWQALMSHCLTEC